MNRKGVALTVVIAIIVSVSLVSVAAMKLGYHQRLIAKRAVGARTTAYYFAQAGVVDANELIRVNTGGVFDTATYDPAPYTIDVNLDAKADVTVDIGPRNAAGFRAVRATGKG